ncbi:uncharacterized protein LOC109087125 [Cyprinus carpio]|uniref:Uncharacterized protein LOC109087125 n=1 Tax=Cyprinus carpio TaxID=7962 RepID=A0A9Q9YME3_CYPCA|nr:uncharacterized protein LOC109087125 [Cyprinus carpio]
MELFVFIAFQLLMEVQSYNSLLKPFITVSDDQLFISCEIPLSVRTDFICSLYTEDDVLLYQRVSLWSQSGKNLCMFYVNCSELFTRSVNSRQLICVYSRKTEPEIRSPHSDTYTFRDTITVRDTITSLRVSTVTSAGKTLTTATKTTSTSTDETLTTATKTSVFTAASTLPDSTRETETSVPHTVHTHSEGSWLSVVLFSQLLVYFCLDS